MEFPWETIESGMKENLVGMKELVALGSGITPPSVSFRPVNRNIFV